MPFKNTNLSLQKNMTIIDVISENIKRWYIVVGTVIISLIITLIYTIWFVTPLYKSTAKLYIINKQTEQITSSDFSISSYISFDFAEIVVDTPIMKQVSAELDNKYSVATLKKHVSVRKPDNTRIIEITASTPNATDSKRIVDSICKISEAELVELMGLDRIRIISEGEVPSAPFTPNLKNNILFALIISLAISEIVIIINYILNNKISSSKDVEKYLDLSILGTIPYNHGKAKSKL